jgi:hypothetical protein
MSKKQKLTTWFPTQTRPAHVGAYEVRDRRIQSHCKWFSYWDGRCWLSTTWEPARTWLFGSEAGASSVQEYEWRGLAEPPK